MLFKYFFAWFGMMVIAIINGGVRDFVYRQRVGNLPAYQISTVVLIVLLAGYIWFLTRTWSIQSSGQAWTIGAIWLLMTLIFEFGMGRAAGDSWSRLFQAYNIFTGQVWIFIPLGVLVGPYLFVRYVQPK